jgi:hypothetical protein
MGENPHNLVTLDGGAWLYYCEIRQWRVEDCGGSFISDAEKNGSWKEKKKKHL